jgi:hypothetical protein
MTEPKSGFEVLQGYPADVLAIAAHGRITRADYEKTLIPLVAQKVKAKGKVKLLYVLAQDFGGFTAGAAWDDARLGLTHLGDFARIAVVTDVEWIRLGVKMFAPLIRCPVHLFHTSDMDEAAAWIAGDDGASGPPWDSATEGQLPKDQDMA